MSNFRSASVGALALMLAGGGAAAQQPGEVSDELPAAGLDVSPGDVIVSSLGEVDPLMIGVRTDGLPASLWTGSDLAAIADAASHTRGESDSLAASELAARVLESAGRAPEGGEGDIDAATFERAAALLNLGRFEAVDAILTQTPRGLDDPYLAALTVRARLATYEIVPACDITEAMSRGRNATFWVRMRVACLAWAEEDAAVSMTLDLLTENQGDLADEVFADWVAAAQAGRTPDNPRMPRDAVEVALARSAGHDYSIDAIRQAPLAAVVSVALDPEADVAIRAFAGERAARAGAMPAMEYANILALRDAENAELSTVEALADALEAAETPADFVVQARIARDALADIGRSENLVGIAPRFALAAAAAGDAQLAMAWLDPRTENAPPASAEDAEDPGGFEPGPASLFASGAFAARAAAPVPDLSDSPIERDLRTNVEAVAAAVDARATPRRLAALAAARLETAREGEEAVRAEARRDALILLALGAQSTPQLRRAASTAVVEALPIGTEGEQIIRAARLAAQAGAIGEAALRAAEAAAATGPGHAPTYASVIEILRAMGLEDHARAFAVEAMLASRVGDPSDWR